MHATHTSGAPTFPPPSARRASCSQELKARAAADRLAADDYSCPPPISYLNGKPDQHSFRPPFNPAKMPPGAQPNFVLTGRVWPKGEAVPPSVLRGLGDTSLRLAATENEHPAARSGRADYPLQSSLGR